MLYLNEDVVNSQIKICTEREDLEGVKCPACCKVKSQKIYVPIACEQLGTDYIDYQDRKKRQKKEVAVTPINWSPLKAAYRQTLTIKRPPRKFAISF